jgi:hypothetical protein
MFIQILIIKHGSKRGRAEGLYDIRSKGSDTVGRRDQRNYDVTNRADRFKPSVLHKGHMSSTPSD